MNTTRYGRPLAAGLAYLLLLAVIALYLLPLGMTILYSFKTNQEMLTGSALSLPARIQFDNFVSAVRKVDYLRSVTNSLIITVSTVALALFLSGLAGYGITRGQGRQFSALYLFFILGLLIPYQAIFVPTYLIGSRYGMINSRLGVVLFSVAGQLPFCVFFMAGFVKTIPQEIEQAAVIDGCGMFKTFILIVLPLLKPALVALSVMRSLSVWNDYLLPKLFLQRKSLQTLTVAIANMFGQYRYNLNVAFSAIIISAIPILVFYLANQRNIEKGIVSGAVKG